MNQTWENGEKPDFRPDFGQFDPILGPEKWWKTSFWAWITPVVPIFFFFFLFFFQKIWLSQSIDFMGNYHYVQYQKKLMIQSWENLVKDGQTDRQADGQMAESDFIGRCPTLSVQK